MPSLHGKVHNAIDESMVISLDVTLGTRVALFRGKLSSFGGRINLAAVTIDGSKMSFFASTGDYRKTGEKIKRLVAGVSYRLQRARDKVPRAWRYDF